MGSRTARSLLLVSAAAVAAALALPGPGVRAARPTTKTVQLVCSPGWRASGGGAYGGVSFTVSCNSGRGMARIVGASGTAYTVRMGAESSSVALDCFFSGDAAQVSENCGEVRLTIR